MLVAGAGPSGAELCRVLAREGIDVWLAERLPHLDRAAFSSAALPLEALDTFGLPASVVAARWSGWQLLGPGGQRRQWKAERPQGAVLDFAALRRWLVEEACRWGGRLLLGHAVVRSRRTSSGVLSTLQAPDGSRFEVLSDWLVDATGQARALLGEPPANRAGPHGLVSGIGLEWLLEVPPGCWQRWRDRLSFVLGSGWVPQGYGWVFPMQERRLKIGVCRLVDPAQQQPPLGTILQGLIHRLLNDEERRGVTVLDRHGGRIRSTIDRREPHRSGRLLAVGDAVSTANLLGGEGIRHALLSSRLLAPLLLESMQRRQGGGVSLPGRARDPLDRYPAELSRGLGRWRWTLSGRLAYRTWMGLRDEAADARLTRLLTSLETQPAEALGELLFGYRFERYGLRALPYLLGWR